MPGPDDDTVEVAIPYGLRRRELVLDDAARNAYFRREIEWMHYYAKEEELADIFEATVCLLQVDAGTFAECLRTAIIWERG